MEIDITKTIRENCEACCFDINSCSNLAKEGLIKNNERCTENEFSYYVDLYAEHYQKKRF